MAMRPYNATSPSSPLGVKWGSRCRGRACPTLLGNVYRGDGKPSPCGARPCGLGVEENEIGACEAAPGPYSGPASKSPAEAVAGTLEWRESQNKKGGGCCDRTPQSIASRLISLLTNLIAVANWIPGQHPLAEA